MRSRRSTALMAAVVLAATGLAACGDDDEDTASSPPPPPAAQTEPGAEGTAAAKTVEIGTDPGGKLAFVQDSLTAPAGSVTFAFSNPADVPHDFKIEKDGEDVGGTEVVTKSDESLNVDLEPGTYTYYCSVGSHRDAGMEGELTVE